MKDLGIPPFDQDIIHRANAITADHATRPHASEHENEKCRIEELRLLLERRLRFVVSEEFKDAKREKARKEREDEAAQRKKDKAMQKRKQKRTAKADEMNSDCFDSDGSAEEQHTIACLPETNAYQPLVHAKSDYSDTSDEDNHRLNHRVQGSKEAFSSQVISSPNNFAACNDGLDSDEERTNSITPANPFKTDGVSSDDEWDDKFGMVVAGSFFR